MGIGKHNLVKRRWPGVAAPAEMPALNQHSSTPREIQTAVLPNGLRIVTEVMPSVRSVSLEFGSAAVRALNSLPKRTLAFHRTHGLQRH